MKTLLSEIDILALDCQTTGANPQKGNLLEIGWAVTGGTSGKSIRKNQVKSYLAGQPENSEIPAVVSRITGITREIMDSAVSPEKIWKKLSSTAKRVAASNLTDLCPAVIHFARFEKPFLKHLHEQFSLEDDFPFNIICTHEIAKQLLPDIPRRGLRAVAGYFGHSVDEFRRSAHHVEATVFVWKKLVELLEHTHGINRLDSLMEWLDQTTSSQSTGREYPMDRSLRFGLPDKPGVYRMLRSNGDVLYVGKAKSLKRRVNSYFQKRTNHSEHVLEMLTQAKQLETTVTGTALEAAILEQDEIKACSPPYNKAMRERDRKLWYCSADMKRYGAQPDDDLIFGPLPSKESIEPFSVLEKLLNTEKPGFPVDESVCSSATGMPVNYAPDSDCFKEGLEIFRSDNRNKLLTRKFPQSLLSIGAELWLIKLEKLKTGKEVVEPEVEEDQPEIREEWIWTPESAAKAIGNSVMHGAFMLRRAFWYCRLSESVLVWNLPNCKKRRCLIIENGQIIQSIMLKPGDIPPAPVGSEKDYLQRRQNFDLVTYGRMRVLTTEIRRLISEERDVKLIFNSSTTFENNKLKEALKWV